MMALTTGPADNRPKRPAEAGSTAASHRRTGPEQMLNGGILPTRALRCGEREKRAGAGGRKEPEYARGRTRPRRRQLLTGDSPAQAPTRAKAGRSGREGVNEPQMAGVRALPGRQPATERSEGAQES